MRDIFVNSNLNLLKNFRDSNRTTEFKNILSWNISQMTIKTILINKRITKSVVIKRSIPLEVRPDENIYENPQNFLVIWSVQKEFSSLYKVQDYAYE